MSKETDRLRRELAESERCDRYEERIAKAKCPFCGKPLKIERGYWRHEWLYDAPNVTVSCPCGVINFTSSDSENITRYSQALREVCFKLNV